MQIENEGQFISLATLQGPALWQRSQVDGLRVKCLRIFADGNGETHTSRIQSGSPADTAMGHLRLAEAAS